MVENFSPTIIYEDADVLIVNKPAGWLVHGVYDKTGAKHNEETVVDWAIRYAPEIAKVGDDPARRPGVVHRLDRETSGVLLIAKNQNAFVFFKNQFQSQTVEKKYFALVLGHVKNDVGKIDRPISIKDGSVKRTVFKGKMERPALTEYRVVERLVKNGEPMTLVEVFPKTGRTHQIRVHFSSIGHQVVGDKLYGKRKTTAIDRHFLHAASLKIKLLNGSEFIAEAPLPKELKEFLGAR